MTKVSYGGKSLFLLTVPKEESILVEVMIRIIMSHRLIYLSA